MGSPVPDQAITTADAEIACIQGDAEVLSRYLRLTDNPSPDVIKNIAACLLANGPNCEPGPGNWKLEFSPRNGRPPRHCPEITSAALAIGHGQATPFGQYLRAEPILDADTRRALADVFDPGPDASSKWRLRFRHPGRGFPRSQLKNTLILAEIGHRALKLRGNGMKWHEVYREMPHSETLIKKAVQLVLKSRLGKPLD